LPLLAFFSGNAYRIFRTPQVDFVFLNSGEFGPDYDFIALVQNVNGETAKLSFGQAPWAESSPQFIEKRIHFPFPA
jgi:hypothetical protein